MSTESWRDRTMPFLASSGWHTLSYREWGNARNQKVLMCVHGLSRNRLDFDTIAEALSDHYRVISVDMPGRGLSDWMPNPGDYSYAFFQQVLVSVLAVTGAKQVDWLGTSMGGILGMGLASRPGSLIRRLVLNDIGPFISGASRGANADAAAAGSVPFETEEEGIAFITETKKSFGPFTPEAARKFALDSLARSADGKWRIHYDPLIVAGRDRNDADMWDLWNRISVPVFTLWGTESTLLQAATVERMRATGPRTEVIAIEGVGHCPGLTTEREISAIREFLLR